MAWLLTGATVRKQTEVSVGLSSLPPFIQPRTPPQGMAPIAGGVGRFPLQVSLSGNAILDILEEYPLHGDSQPS